MSESDRMIYELKCFEETRLTFSMSGVGESFCAEIIVMIQPDRLPPGLDPSTEGLTNWLKERTIPRNRAFAQSFLAKQGLNIKDTKAILDISKGLSLNDAIWITPEGSGDRFAHFNLYENPISRILSDIAFTGFGSRLKSEFRSSPEFTTNGMLAKSWRRLSGRILLYKSGTEGAANTGQEPYSEFYAHQIAAALGIQSVPYSLARWHKKLCSTCELFTNMDVGYVPIRRLVKKGGYAGVYRFYQELGENYCQRFREMILLDALICNEDRHFGNFGLLFDNHDSQLIGPAPLFDHGLSLFNFAMPDDLDDLDAYAQTRLAATGENFLDLVQTYCEPQELHKLARLQHFRFQKHHRHNLPDERLKAIESFIRHRAQILATLK